MPNSSTCQSPISILTGVSLPDCWCFARSGVVAAETADARIRARWSLHQHRKSWPIPLTMQVANFGAKHGGEWAPSRRNLGSLFVCSKQKRSRICVACFSTSFDDCGAIFLGLVEQAEAEIPIG